MHLLLLLLLSFPIWANEQTCGKTINTSWLFDSEKISFSNAILFEEEICLDSELFPGANFELQLLDEKENVLFKRYAYFPQITISHPSKKSDPDIIVPIQESYKIIKLPQFPKIKETKKYKFIGIGNKKYFEGKIKL